MEARADKQSMVNEVRVRGARERWRWAVAFVIGLLFVPIAFQLRLNTDQLLFLDYAGELLSGARLYIDVWDNKQPGIFILYAAMEALFGVNWTHMVAGYAFWMCSAAATIAMVARAAVPAGWAWLLAVPFTLGVTWLRSSSDQIAQIEEWVALPLSAILLLALRSEPAGAPIRLRWAVIGALAAGVAMLKLVLAPVALLIVVTLTLARFRTERLPVRHVAVALGWAIAGFLIACVPVLAWLALRGSWDAFWWTTFEYPGLALVGAERAPISRLVSSLGWLAKATLPLAPAVALALLAAWREPRARLARVVAGALAWMLGGFLMIVTQKFSWWPYHMSLLVWPIGLLAAIGCAVTLPKANFRFRLPRLVLAICASGLALQGALLVSKWTRTEDWPYPARIQAAIDTAHEVVRTATIVCGTSVTIGDQNGLQSATGLKRAMSTNGVFWGAFLPEQVRRLPDELSAARPDLVFMDADQREDFARRFPDVLKRIEDWLAADYRSRTTDALNGRWWERAASARDVACPERAPFAIPRH